MNTIGRYQLVEKLGQGGMGVVYRAFDTLLQRVVAVKLISGTIEPGSEQRERFFREARAAGQLSHRNIITIHDLGEHEGQPYLAMEYLEGEDLQHRLSRADRMSLTRKVELAVEICEGLAFAHARGVVHRDIKPANIFITENGTAKILDFGLARLTTSELTNSNMMMGTVNYMAPEQVRGERADQRSDIFAVGVVLYELLGGRKAFDGESVAATLYKIMQEDPRPLLDIDPTLPPDLVAIVDRALAKPRDERYQEMSELLRDLAVYRQQRIASDSPAFGRPGSGAPVATGTLPRPASGAGSGGAEIAPEGVQPASGQRPAAWRLAPWMLAAAGAIAIIAAAFWSGGWPQRPAPDPAADSAARPGAGNPEAASALRSARQALDGGDPWEAQRHADAALAIAPGDPEARRLRDQIATTLSGLERALGEARTHFNARRFEEASRAAGMVLALAPGHPEARQLMETAAAELGGKGAEEARSRMIRAKAAAQSAEAARLATAAYNAALGAERTAQRAYDGGNLNDAAAKFYEASGLFRSAELSAQAEAAARADRAAAARAEKDRLEKERAEQERADQERADQERAERERADKARAAAPPAKPEPPVREPQPPPPATPPTAEPPAARPPAPEPTAEALILRLLEQYEAALESRSLGALKRLWPTLTGAQESAIRTEFEHASRIEVGITSPRVEVVGGTATATFVRQYDLLTTDGQRLSSRSLTTISFRRTVAGWVIEQVRYEPVR